MYPRVVLCEEHPRAVVKLSSGRRLLLEISRDLAKLEIRTAAYSDKTDCILYLPYHGMYLMSDDVVPLKSGDVEYISVVVDTRRVLRVYELQIRGDKVSMYAHSLDDNFFRGYVKCNHHDVAKRILKKLLKQYLMTTSPICSCLIKMIHESSIDVEAKIRELDGLRHVVVEKGSTKILYRPGLSVLLRKLGITRTNVSIICTISHAEKFVDYVMSLFDLCDTVLEFRLGRVESVNGVANIILDVFTQSLTSTR